MKLEARDVCFSYSKRGARILNHVSLSIDSGEVVGLVGPSGYGKSTLGRILAGQITADSGKVLLDGNPPPCTGFNPVQLIYQHPELAVNPKWKLKRTLGECGGADPALAERMGIKPAFLDRWPNELSGGELQRFCVLRILKPDTKFIVADEISTMLDVITQQEIWSIVLEYARGHGIGILAITHNKHLAGAICTRIVRLEDLQAA